jgi:hypothetical protein
MNINKSKSKSVLFLFLIYFFAAFTVHADTGKRSFFAVTSGPIFMQHSFVALVMPGNVQARLQAAEDEREVGRVGKMILAGIAGNLVGIFGGWGLGAAASGQHDSDHVAAGSPLGAVIGSALGSALGVYLAGNTNHSRGNLGSALGGSLLGIAAAIAVSMPLIGQESGVGISVGLVALAILPPVGSAILFNKSLRPRSLPKGDALFNLSQGRFGLGVPNIHIRPLRFPARDVKTDWQFNVRVFGVML